VYCSYDIFSGCDVRCHVKIPGGVTVKAVTGSGQEVPVDDGIWRGIAVSSFIRTTMLHPNLLLGLEVPNLAVLKSHERFPCSLQDEAFLLDSVMYLMRAGRIRQVRDRLHYDGAKGCRSEHVDVVSLALLNHFTHVQRVSVLQNIFHQMSADFNDPIQAIYEAACMRYLGKQQEALQYLEYTISLVRQDLEDEEGYGEVFSPLYTAVAELCLDLDNPADEENLNFGFEAAVSAVRLNPGYRPARIILSRLRAVSCFNSPNSMAGFREALLSLNQIQPPQDIEETEDILVLIPQWSRMVEPRDGTANVDTRMMAKLKEEFEDYGRAKLMELPGNILVPHKMLLTHDYYLYNFASAVRREVYLILVEIVAELEWDPFLQLRATTFFMESADSETEDGESESESGGSGESTSLSEAGEVSVNIDVEDDVNRDDGAAENHPESGAVETEAKVGPGTPHNAEVAVEIAEEGSEGEETGDPDDEDSSSEQEESGVNVEDPVDSEPKALEAVVVDVAGADAAGAADEDGEQNGGSEIEECEGPSPSGVAQVEEKMKALQVSGRSPAGREESRGVKMEEREVCNIWLDEIIYALYSDLEEYVEFRIHVKNIKKAIDNDFEVAGTEYDTQYEDDEDEEDPDTDEEVIAVSMFSGQNIAADWFRRGILAERIFRPEEAERSHRAALNSQFKMVSCVTLLRMYAETQRLKEACEMATRALKELHPALLGDPAKQVELPFAVQDAFFHMISRSGLQAVRRAQQQLGGKAPAAITEIFHQAVEWHIAGFAH